MKGAEPPLCDCCVHSVLSMANTHRPLFQPPFLFPSPPAGYCKQGKGKLGVFPLPKHVGSSSRLQHQQPQPPRLLFGYHSHVPLTWGKVMAEPLLPLLLIKTLEEILSWSKYSLLPALAHWFQKATEVVTFMLLTLILAHTSVVK